MITKLVNAGIDFIRLTSDRPEVISKMADAAYLIQTADNDDGEKPRRGGMLGFFGWKTKHCFYGVRGDWWMLQVTGYVAREQMHRLWGVKANCTRLDIQHTYQQKLSQDFIIGQAEEDSFAKKPENGRHWKTRLERVDKKNQTLYIGARQSEWFGRIYDKEAESKKDIYKGCVRYEIEIKGEASRDIWARYASGSITLYGLLALVPEWFDAHGVGNNWVTEFTSQFEPEPKPPTSIKRKIGWLATQVSGTLASLMTEGYFFEATQALFHKMLLKDELLVLACREYFCYNEIR